MKKRAPTLPPTIIDRPIIDRGLSMIAMRVTFSRACARARKKKSDIICARKCAQMRARESEEEMKKNAFFRYRYKSFSFLSPNFPCFFFFCDEENKRRERDYVKSAYFPALSSCERFMRCMGASAQFSAPLIRARSPVKARAWRGQGRGWRVKLSCKVGFLFRVSNSQLSFSCVFATLFF